MLDELETINELLLDPIAAFQDDDVNKIADDDIWTFTDDDVAEDTADDDDTSLRELEEFEAIHEDELLLDPIVMLQDDEDTLDDDLSFWRLEEPIESIELLDKSSIGAGNNVGEFSSLQAKIKSNEQAGKSLNKFIKNPFLIDIRANLFKNQFAIFPHDFKFNIKS